MVFYLHNKTNNNNIMMKLSEVRTVEDMADYADALANDIKGGIESVDGREDAECIADLVVHCMNLARLKTKTRFENQIKRRSSINAKLTEAAPLEKRHWNLLSEKSPACVFPAEEGDFESEKILIKNASGFIYEAIARRFPEQSNTSFLTAESKDFEDGNSFICEVYIDDVVEWMEIPKN